MIKGIDFFTYTGYFKNNFQFNPPIKKEMMMKNSARQLTFKVTETERAEIKEQAKRAGKDVSKLIRDALSFSDNFDAHFLSHMEKIADKVKLPTPVVIQNFITVYIAAESAALEEYGANPTVYRRAFQYSESGELLTGDKLSSLAFGQSVKNLKKLKKQLAASSKGGKSAKISFEDAAFIADHRSPNSFSGLL